MIPWNTHRGISKWEKNGKEANREYFIKTGDNQNFILLGNSGRVQVIPKIYLKKWVRKLGYLSPSSFWHWLRAVSKDNFQLFWTALCVGIMVGGWEGTFRHSVSSIISEQPSIGWVECTMELRKASKAIEICYTNPAILIKVMAFSNIDHDTPEHTSLKRNRCFPWLHDKLRTQL